jgi:hypothetical protein
MTIVLTVVGLIALLMLLGAAKKAAKLAITILVVATGVGACFCSPTLTEEVKEFASKAKEAACENSGPIGQSAKVCK